MTAALFLLQRPGTWWCPMCPGGGAWGWGMMLLMGLFWLLVLALVVWLIVRLASGGRGRYRSADEPDRARTILRERYARGEIDEETYRRMLRELDGE